MRRKICCAPLPQTPLRLLSIARPYWWQLGLLMGAAGVSSTLNLTYPALLGTVIDSVVASNVTALHSVVVTLLALAALQSLFTFGQGFWMNALGERIVIDLRIRLYSHLQHLPLSSFQDNRTGELLSRLTNDVTRVQAAVTTNLITMVQNVLTLLLGLAIVITGPEMWLAKANQFNLHVPLSRSGINLGIVLVLVTVALIPIAFLPLFTRTYVRKLMRREVLPLSVVDNSNSSPTRLTAWEPRLILASQGVLSMLPISSSEDFYEPSHVRIPARRLPPSFSGSALVS